MGRAATWVIRLDVRYALDRYLPGTWLIVCCLPLKSAEASWPYCICLLDFLLHLNTFLWGMLKSVLSSVWQWCPMLSTSAVCDGMVGWRLLVPQLSVLRTLGGKALSVRLRIVVSISSTQLCVVTAKLIVWIWWMEKCSMQCQGCYLCSWEYCHVPEMFLPRTHSGYGVSPVTESICPSPIPLRRCCHWTGLTYYSTSFICGTIPACWASFRKKGND